MLRIVRYIARSNVTYPAPNKVMSIVVSLVENNHRKNRKKIARTTIGMRIFFIDVSICNASSKLSIKLLLIENFMQI